MLSFIFMSFARCKYKPLPHFSRKLSGLGPVARPLLTMSWGADRLLRPRGLSLHPRPESPILQVRGGWEDWGSKKKRNKLSNWRLSLWSQVWARFCRVQVWVLGPGLVERREERNHNYLHHNWAGSPHPPHSIHLPVFKVSVIHVIKKMS